jgi:hypothetical protein
MHPTSSIMQHYGGIMATLWRHYDSIMATLWRHYGGIMVALWHGAALWQHWSD